jgi:hypothetical protein
MYFLSLSDQLEPKIAQDLPVYFFLAANLTLEHKLLWVGHDESNGKVLDIHKI